jgi:uncharacterized protein (UPF0332 family)
MDLKDCERQGFLRESKVDKDLISSLLVMSKRDEETVLSANLNSKNISSYSVMAYSSLRKIMEALCLQKGYKITNHICTGLFLKKNIEGFDYVFFDRIRRIRNQINYYGESVDLEIGMDLIKKIFGLNKFLREHFK